MTVVALLYGLIIGLAGFWADVHVFFATLFGA